MFSSCECVGRAMSTYALALRLRVGLLQLPHHPHRPEVAPGPRVHDRLAREEVVHRAVQPQRHVVSAPSPGVLGHSRATPLHPALLAHGCGPGARGSGRAGGAWQGRGQVRLECNKGARNKICIVEKSNKYCNGSLINCSPLQYLYDLITARTRPFEKEEWWIL